MGEGPPGRRPHDAAGDRRVEARRAGSDPRAVDVEARARGSEATRPEGVAGVPRREAPARCARELARPSPRGERGEARQRGARHAEGGRRRAAGLRRGLHAARHQLLEAARERLGSIQEVAGWIADNLPQPKTGPARTRRRRRRKRRGPETQTANPPAGGAAVQQPAEAAAAEPAPTAPWRRRAKSRKAETIRQPGSPRHSPSRASAGAGGARRASRPQATADAAATDDAWRERRRAPRRASRSRRNRRRPSAPKTPPSPARACGANVALP